MSHGTIDCPICTYYIYVMFGDRSFATAAPRLWNSPPQKESETLAH